MTAAARVDRGQLLAIRRRSAATTLGVGLLAALALTAVLAPWLSRVDPAAIAGDALHPPGGAHLFGTDDLGRDVFAGVVHGARHSLLVGVIAATLSTLVALLVGGVAGMRGGAVDQVLMRGTEFVQALPRFFLILLVVSLFGSAHAVIVLVIGLTSWPSTARVFRALVHRRAGARLRAGLAGGGRLGRAHPRPPRAAAGGAGRSPRKRRTRWVARSWPRRD